MAYKKADLEKLASILKIDASKFIADYESAEEKDIVIPDGSYFTPDELTARDAQQKADGKREGISEGRDAGKEIAVKDLKKAFGVEFDGKDFTKLTDAVKAQFAKGDEGLKDQVKLLQQNLADRDSEIGSLKNAAESARQDAGLLAMLPKDRLSTIADSEYLTLMKAALKFEQQDGKTVVSKDGQILRDQKTTNPLAASEAVNAYFAERKWIAEQQQLPVGRGGKSVTSAGKSMKMSEAVADWESQGKNVASAEFNAHVKELAASNDQFDFYS